MFTGLIQALGKLHHLDDDKLKIICVNSDASTSVQCASILTGMDLGDSIAVNGVCLTVDTALPDGFIAVASPETQTRSTLGNLPDDTLVNLETSLKVGSKIGGHFVTGHVDGIGHLAQAEPRGNTWEIEFSLTSPTIAQYIVPKGSIAVDGISLTVADCTPAGDWFKVAVIPVTYTETILQHLQPGDPVNLEGDILGKYVQRFTQLGSRTQISGEDSVADSQWLNAATPALSLDFLADHGYL